MPREMRWGRFRGEQTPEKPTPEKGNPTGKNKRSRGRLLAGWRLGVLLALPLLMAVLPWAMPPHDGAPGHAAPPAAKSKEGDDGAKAVLERIAKRQAAVRSLTSRGQSIADAPPFTVRERTEALEYFPCNDCHEAGEPNPLVRELEEEHDTLQLDHGGGRFWCYDACHNTKDITKLASLRGEPISFNESYKLCGQCHFERQKDWYFGGHGKRVGAFDDPNEIPVTYQELKVEERESIGSWRGERVLTLCTECHNAHSPAIKPYEASPPPPVRSGLVRPELVHDNGHAPVWAKKGEAH